MFVNFVNALEMYDFFLHSEEEIQLLVGQNLDNSGLQKLAMENCRKCLISYDLSIFQLFIVLMDLL